MISDSPWMRFNNYLVVTKWNSKFASPHPKVEKNHGLIGLGFHV